MKAMIALLGCLYSVSAHRVQVQQQIMQAINDFVNDTENSTVDSFVNSSHLLDELQEANITNLDLDALGNASNASNPMLGLYCDDWCVRCRSGKNIIVHRGLATFDLARIKKLAAVAVVAKAPWLSAGLLIDNYNQVCVNLQMSTVVGPKEARTVGPKEDLLTGFTYFASTPAGPLIKGSKKIRDIMLEGTINYDRYAHHKELAQKEGRPVPPKPTPTIENSFAYLMLQEDQFADFPGIRAGYDGKLPPGLIYHINWICNSGKGDDPNDQIFDGYGIVHEWANHLQFKNVTFSYTYTQNRDWCVNTPQPGEPKINNV